MFSARGVHHEEHKGHEAKKEWKRDDERKLFSPSSSLRVFCVLRGFIFLSSPGFLKTSASGRGASGAG
ncbi:MAG: hypothetical protein ACKV2V_01365, partial [Blastocatellia bacterium]